MLVVLCAERRVAYRCVVVGCCCQMVCGGWNVGNPRGCGEICGSVPREKVGVWHQKLRITRRFFLRGGTAGRYPPPKQVYRPHPAREGRCFSGVGILVCSLCVLHSGTAHPPQPPPSSRSPKKSKNAPRRHAIYTTYVQVPSSDRRHSLRRRRISKS